MRSVFKAIQLPPPELPEIAFAGRSNVGKSSLINRLVRRTSLVKTSSRPGKTRSLNFFEVDSRCYLVDLPGYGFARVGRRERQGWQRLVENYLQRRETLRCVVVLIDIRHPLKTMDASLMDWLGHMQLPFLPIYTKADKLSRGRQNQQAVALDRSIGISAADRLIFSARTGQGCADLEARLAALVSFW